VVIGLHFSMTDGAYGSIRLRSFERLSGRGPLLRVVGLALLHHLVRGLGLTPHVCGLFLCGLCLCVGWPFGGFGECAHTYACVCVCLYSASYICYDICIVCRFVVCVSWSCVCRVVHTLVNAICNV